MKLTVALRVLATCCVLASGPAWAAGAIAVDSEDGQKAGDEGYGIGWGDTRAEAGAKALRKCREAGNESCKVVARFDACGVYASNRTTYAVGWGATEASAREMARDKCPTCRVVLAECE